MTAKRKGLCRHCQKVRSNRPRGLCWTCYHKPDVRERYPSESKYAKLGEGLVRKCPGPGEPTDALPGTEDKIRVLTERVRLGQELFHPADAAVVGDMTIPARPPSDSHPCDVLIGWPEEEGGDE